MSRSSRRARKTHPGVGDSVPWYARIPVALSPVVASLILLASALAAVPPIRDAVTLGPTVDAHLRLAPTYVVMAPISNVLDTITLLAVPQHIAVGVWAILFFVLARVIAWRRRDPSRPAGRAAAAELVASLGLLGGLLMLYAAAAFLPRPMARLELARTDALAVDFHAHTQYSHDGRKSWTPARLRQWGRDAGFDAIYISDHRTYEGAREGIAGNPSHAGDGLMLLPAVEAVLDGEHVNILSAGKRYQSLLTPDMRSVDPTSLAMASLLNGFEPIVIETLPGHLDKMIPSRGAASAGVRAIELIDGSPRGLTQTRRERARIIALSDSLHLARVVGSDNHGYGRVAAGWTLIKVPDWRTLSGDSLATFVEFAIRFAAERATRVIERRVADGSTPVRAALTPVLVPWRMFTTLSGEERVSWLAWIWAAWALMAAIRRRRAAATD